MRIETETVPFTERPTLIEGAVGLLSTVPDYLRLAQMLLHKGELDGVQLLEAKTVETMTANGLSDAVQRARGGSMGWGLANVNVVLTSSPNSGHVGEYGWDGTAGTIFWVGLVACSQGIQTRLIRLTDRAPGKGCRALPGRLGGSLLLLRA